MNLISLGYSLLLLFLRLDYAVPMAMDSSVPDWDVLIFTQQWPKTVCKEWKDRNPSHTCALPSKQDSWTIHGIWPTKLGTIGPAFCNRTWHFDPKLIKPIEGPLEQFWTNIEEETSTYSLWSHEWTKHGTCAAVLEPLNNEFKYFSKGLEWVQKYSLENILKAKNIVPSNDKFYKVQDIHSAIHQTLGTNPAIECRQEKGGKNWIVEIRLCFDKNLDITNCDGILGLFNIPVYHDGGIFDVITNCDMTNGVVYPEDLEAYATPNRLYVQLYNLISWLQWFTL